MNKKKVIIDFVGAINKQDIQKIFTLMAEKFKFVDSQDNAYVGRVKMKEAWIKYFELFPNYKIKVDSLILNEDCYIAFGHASGTLIKNGKLLKKNSWQIPACWRSKVDNDLVSFWQVYADNSPVFEILKANSSSENQLRK